jgi:tRNA pseudouridine55 synthase
MATGVLLVCLGQATRVSEYLGEHDKKYRARVRLGVETDTYDAAGTVIAQAQVAATREQVVAALESFVGQLSQMPPAYSAIKQKGIPLYKLARKGIEVETAPRPVEIYSLRLREFLPPDVEIDVHCSKGTYVRSLAHDLGQALGCGAHLAALQRTASGHFALEDSVGLDRLREAFENGFASQYFIPIDEALLQFEAIVVDNGTAKRIQQGSMLVSDEEHATPLLRAYNGGGELVALLERGSASREWKPKKVFLV